jgi:predicted alpha/beta superfamily hydrolase
MSMKWRLVLMIAACTAGPGVQAAGPDPQAVPAHESFTLASTVLHETRRINVYAPPGYTTDATTRYPVLYMPDGGMAEDFPHVAVDVDAAIRAGRMRPMIVVGIENTERRRDMTGPTEVASDRKIAPHVGGSQAFRAFIADELMPEVRRRYRTGGGTAIIGESLAGLFIVETFLERPDLFDTYIALSPSLWWNHEALADSAAARFAAWPAATRKTLYLASAGDDIIGNALDTLCAALRGHAPPGVTWTYEPRPDLGHATIYRGLSPSVFRKLFPPPA